MKTRILLALHFHQPVGNFDHVFEAAVDQCYRPIVEHFERHPGVHAAFHLSGCLLEWLEANDSKLIDQIIALVGRGQIEPLGGAFYEPILTAIPREDALEQISLMRDYWSARTGVTPTGAWLAERVWEPCLADLLSCAQVGYTILDDQHLRYAGLPGGRLGGAYCTERAGAGIAVLPTDFELRYHIPFQSMEKLEANLSTLEGDAREWVLTYGDDAEKFGFWPGTHEWVYGKDGYSGWLERFLARAENGSAPFYAQSPAAYLAESPPLTKVYIPNASYTEMLEWALPPASVPSYVKIKELTQTPELQAAGNAFVRGSLWDAFLARYPESDHMHKHVLRSSRQAAAAGIRDARTAALRAECNCAYWHGLFGGIYLPHLRHGVYEQVLAADALLLETLAAPRALAEDIDGDLREEVILQSARVQAFFKPEDAGTLCELDYLPARFNVTNVMARWRESYHSGADITHESSDSDGVASPHERAVGIEKDALADYHFDKLPLRSLREFTAEHAPGAAGLGAFAGMNRASAPLKDWRIEGAGFVGAGSAGGARFEKRVAFESDTRLACAWKIQEIEKNACFGVML
ncbi:MAG: DUF1925 domain-containing protein, partial [Chrysiogenetes bacterium]|nr:DUF1925 domain-containing protein [Chrysiogenetes bacterium]